ncbi:MAG: hypothetical protein ACT4N8_07785 [Sphingosinicella sp.]|uniref:hypothetical protein n=1 Tax=Sphingosinicella sp. TaxID=1917971 RepID=UPI00403819F0
MGEDAERHRTIATLLVTAGALMEDGSVDAVSALPLDLESIRRRTRSLARIGREIALLTATAEILSRPSAREV